MPKELSYYEKYASKSWIEECKGLTEQDLIKEFNETSSIFEIHHLFGVIDPQLYAWEKNGTYKTIIKRNEEGQ